MGAVYALINALWSKRDQQRVKKKKKSERKVDQAMGLYLLRLSSSLSLSLSLYLYTCIYTGRNERNHSSGTEDRNGRWSGLVIFLVYSRAAWSRERILGRFWWSRLECSLRCSSVGNFLLKLLAYWVFGKYVHFRINIYIYIYRSCWISYTV